MGGKFCFGRLMKFARAFLFGAVVGFLGCFLGLQIFTDKNEIMHVCIGAATVGLITGIAAFCGGRLEKIVEGFFSNGL